MEDCTRIVGLLYSSIQFDCDRILWIVRFCKSLLIVARFSWSWCKIQITIVTNKTTHENWHCFPTWRTQYKHNQFLSILLQSKNADTIRKDCGKTVWIAKWFIVKKKIFWLAILLLKKPWQGGYKWFICCRMINITLQNCCFVHPKILYNCCAFLGRSLQIKLWVAGLSGIAKTSQNIWIVF